MIKLAIAGAGRRGLRFLSELLQERPSFVSEVAIADTSESAREGVIGRGIPVFASLLDCIKDFRPDAVIVATSAEDHSSAVHICAERGLHVLCEKPIGLSLEEAISMVQAVRDAGVIGVAGYQTRHFPRTRVVRNWVAQYPAASAIVSTYGWTTHLIDTAIALLGSPIEVSATNLSSGTPDVFGGVPTMQINTTHERGSCVQFAHPMFLRKESPNEVHVVVEGGKVHWRLWADEVCGTPLGRGAEPSSWLAPGIPPLHDFLRAIETGAQPVCSLSDGVEPLSVYAAAVRSARTGKTVRTTDRELAREAMSFRVPD